MGLVLERERMTDHNIELGIGDYFNQCYKSSLAEAEILSRYY